MLNHSAALCRQMMETPGTADLTSLTCVPYAGFAIIDLGVILLEWNELSSAEQLIRGGLERLQKTYHASKIIEGNTALADIGLVRGDPALSQPLRAKKNLPGMGPFAHFAACASGFGRGRWNPHCSGPKHEPLKRERSRKPSRRRASCSGVLRGFR